VAFNTNTGSSRDCGYNGYSCLCASSTDSDSVNEGSWADRPPGCSVEITNNNRRTWNSNLAGTGNAHYLPVANSAVRASMDCDGTRGRYCSGGTPRPYQVLTAGASCAAAGLYEIPSLSDCSKAGTVLGLSNVSAANAGDHGQTGSSPSRCYLGNGTHPQLLHNAAGDITGACSASDPCICRNYESLDNQGPSSTATYVRVTSGASCAANGWSAITTIEECSEAGTNLGLFSTSASSDGQNQASSDPSHCYFKSGALKYNTGGNTGPCTPDDVCLCKTGWSNWKCGCPPGKYARPNLECAECPAGRWNDKPHQTSCAGECSHYKYSDATGLVSDAECKTCPDMRYSHDTGKSDVSQCTGCGLGTMLVSEANATGSPSCQLCAAGFYRDNLTVGTSPCLACPAGRTNNNDDDDNDDGNDNDPTSVAEAVASRDEASDCVACPAGTSFTTRDAPCVVCAAGQYQPAAAADGASCSPCADGKYLADPAADAAEHDQASDCKFCPAGKEFVSATSICNTCRAGAVQDNSTAPFAACRNCPTGRYLLDDRMQEAEHDVVEDCKQCVAGRRFVDRASACEICAAGQFQDTQGDGVACVECSLGRFIDDAGQSVAAHDASGDCKQCDLGLEYTSSDQPCHVCGGGRYQESNSTDDLRCTECAPGRFLGDGNDVEGNFAIMHDQEIDCEACPVGQVSGPGARFCFTCPTGWAFKANATSGDGLEDMCQRCQAGRRSAFVAVAFQGGGINTTNSSSDGGMTICAACSRGQYQPDIGTAFCLPCSMGRFQPRQEADSCLGCPEGWFQSNVSALACASCPSGWGNEGNGSTSCNVVPPGFFVVVAGVEKCPRGYFCAGSDAPSVPCMPGTYASLDGSISCIACSPGKFSPVPASFACMDCEAGTHQALSNRSECIACPKGFASTRNGSAACTECSAGKSASALSSTRCAICRAGTFQEFTARAACADCPEGYASLRNGSAACSECSVGKYMDETGSYPCKQCAKGSIASAPAKATCSQCNAGRYTLEAGSSQCNECVPGKHGRDDEEGCFSCPVGWKRAETDHDLGACLQCPTGWTTPVEGATICSRCGLGSFGSSKGNCTSCPSGWFKDDMAATECSSACANSDKVPNAQGTGCELPPWGTCQLGVEYLHDDPPEDRTAWTCAPCPRGANCSMDRVPTLSTLRAQEGFKRLSWSNWTVRFYGECPNPLACVPTAPDGCALGHDGNASELCSQCLPGWASQDGKQLCAQCLDEGGTAGLFLLAVLLGIVVFSFLVWDNVNGAKDMIPKNDGGGGHKVSMPFHSISIRIVSSFLQVAGMLSQFDLTLPESVRTLVKVESSASSLSEQLLLFDCGTQTRDDYEMFAMKQFVSVWVLPLVCVVCCGLFWSVVHCRGLGKRKNKNNNNNNNNNNKKKNQTAVADAEDEEEDVLPQLVLDPGKTLSSTSGMTAFDGFISSLMVLFYTLFPSVVTRVALTLSCSTFGDVSLMTEALSVQCLSGRHWALVTAVAIPGMSLYAIVAPVALAVVLIRQRRRHHLYAYTIEEDGNWSPNESFEPRWTLRFGFFFAGYRPGYEWWESIVMARKCFFLIMAIFLRAYGPSPQVVTASAILVLALSAHLQHRPYADDAHNFIESVGLHACLMQLLMSLLSNMIGQVGENTLGPTSTAMLVTLVFATTLYFFWVTFAGIIRGSQEAHGCIGALSRRCARQFVLEHQLEADQADDAGVQSSRAHRGGGIGATLVVPKENGPRQQPPHQLDLYAAVHRTKSKRLAHATAKSLRSAAVGTKQTKKEAQKRAEERMRAALNRKLAERAASGAVKKAAKKAKIRVRTKKVEREIVAEANTAALEMQAWGDRERQKQRHRLQARQVKRRQSMKRLKSMKKEQQQDHEDGAVGKG
jgi:hypothetical protein